MAALAAKEFGAGGATNASNWPHSGKATPITTGHLTPADRHGSVQVRKPAHQNLTKLVTKQGISMRTNGFAAKNYSTIGLSTHSIQVWYSVGK